MTLTRPKNSHLIIAFLPDESSAFQAYMYLMRSHGIPPQNLALVGEGYSSPESVGLLEPKRMAWHYARYMSLFLGVAGMAIGALIFVLYSEQMKFLSMSYVAKYSPQFIVVAMAIVFGLLGGGLGVLLGTLYGLLFKSNTSIICRKRLRRGEYILLIEGPEDITRRSREILGKYTIGANPEYVD
ncbi:hypothetical protein Pse7367_1801 [Thalassoporum mexicanum PCC 7367]|uniref:hypothetical protein n=1 Tax=Thalassoporum mexicanum TaxID=3457544 RepID=UPI00029F9219|nr:hypothetical protein [Pseudanabaena sp. PCC 7367]AFY70078.1 hypothetical protein Pse7367_1801 [Pseudanabaena sp. PCC 7367]